MHVISCCCKAGQRKNGVNLGPDLLIKEMKKLANPFFHEIISDELFEKGDGYQMLYDMCNSTTNETLVLGGDHSIAISTVLSSLNKFKNNLKIIWVDAHADINTNMTSETKNKHGMPLSPAFKLMEPWITTVEDQYFIKPNQLVYIGLRSVDEPEKKFIENLGITAYYSTDVEKFGIEKIMDDICKKDNDDTLYHLSFDIDGIDPIYTPSTGTAEGNGITINDGVYITKYLS